MKENTFSDLSAALSSNPPVSSQKAEESCLPTGGSTTQTREPLSSSATATPICSLTGMGATKPTPASRGPIVQVHHHPPGETWRWVR